MFYLAGLLGIFLPIALFTSAASVIPAVILKMILGEAKRKRNSFLDYFVPVLLILSILFIYVMYAQRARNAVLFTVGE